MSWLLPLLPSSCYGSGLHNLQRTDWPELQSSQLCQAGNSSWRHMCAPQDTVLHKIKPKLSSWRCELVHAIRQSYIQTQYRCRMHRGMDNRCRGGAETAQVQKRSAEKRLTFDLWGFFKGLDRSEMNFLIPLDFAQCLGLYSCHFACPPAQFICFA